MSQLFNRQIQVDIVQGSTRIALNRELDISFKCRKDRSTVPNELELEIFNLGPKTRNIVQETDAQVILSAGYGNNMTLLAQMDVERAITEWQPPNSVTKIRCADGLNALKSKKAKISVKKGATVKQVTERLLSALGLPYRIREVDLNVPLKGSFSHDGAISDGLTQVLDKAGAVWGIINNTVIISALGVGIGDTVMTLSPQNGLLAQPELLDDTLISERVLERRLPSTGYQINALLRPSLNPFDKLEIASRNVSGVFVIDTIEHIGGNRINEFITRMEVYEPGRTS